MKPNRKGFTLAELLVVVAIIAILVAVSIPIFTGRLEAAREATCLANRRSLKAVMANDYLNEEYDSMQEAFTKIYGADRAKEKPEFICPKGGEYSWEGGHIKCSVHDGDGSTEEGGGDKEKEKYFPGTDDLEVWDDYWIYQSAQNQKAGGVFKARDGNYYMVVEDFKSWNGINPADYPDYDKVVKLNQSITEFKPSQTYPKGTVLKYNDEYYVFATPEWIDSSPEGKSGVYKIPKTKS